GWPDRQVDALERQDHQHAPNPLAGEDEHEDQRRADPLRHQARLGALTPPARRTNADPEPSIRPTRISGFGRWRHRGASRILRTVMSGDETIYLELVERLPSAVVLLCEDGTSTQVNGTAKALGVDGSALHGDTRTSVELVDRN